jgi:hypothetical protein
MFPEQALDVAHGQKKRLAHIDFRVNYLGSVGRNDLISRFGVKEAAATRDITEYRKLAPNNLSYDGVSKRYTRAETFAPLFNFSSSQVLTALAQGLGDDFVGTHKAFVACETPAHLSKPSLEIISAVSRAIYEKKVLLIEYRSLTSGVSSREIVPFALVDNGLRWHVRAFDRKRSIFTDFVLTRMSKATVVVKDISEHETRDADIQWNRIVELEIAPHPRLKYPETIELDYSMTSGILQVNVRAAQAGYMLRHWNVDCSNEHKLEGDEIQLWLRNPAALYGVKNSLMAPGYDMEA